MLVLKKKKFSKPSITTIIILILINVILILTIVIIIVKSKCEMENICCENKGGAGPTLHQTFLLILPLSGSLLHTGQFLTWEPGKPEYKCVKREEQIRGIES